MGKWLKLRTKQRLELTKITDHDHAIVKSVWKIAGLSESQVREVPSGTDGIKNLK